MPYGEFRQRTPAKEKARKKVIRKALAAPKPKTYKPASAGKGKIAGPARPKPKPKAKPKAPKESLAVTMIRNAKPGLKTTSLSQARGDRYYPEVLVYGKGSKAMSSYTNYLNKPERPHASELSVKGGKAGSASNLLADALVADLQKKNAVPKKAPLGYKISQEAAKTGLLFLTPEVGAPARIARGAKAISKLRTPTRAAERGLEEISAKAGVKAAPKLSKVAKVKRAAGEVRQGRRLRKEERVVEKTMKGTAVHHAGSAVPVAPQVTAIAKGTTEANPKKSAKTTAKAVPGLVTAPVGIAANVGLSGYRAAQTAIPGGKSYSAKQIAEPTKATAKSVIAFQKHLISVYGSADPEKIKKATEDEFGYTLPLMVGPRGVKAIGRPLRGPARAVGKVVKEKTPVGRVIENSAARRRVAHDYVDIGRNVGKATSHRAAKPIVKAERKVKIKHDVHHGGRKMTAGDAVGIVATEGIKTIAHVRRVRAKIEHERAKRGITGESQQLASLDLLESNPHFLKDKHFLEAVDAYKRSAEPMTTSERARLINVAQTHGVQLPEERLPVAARGKTSATNAAELESQVKGQRVVSKSGRVYFKKASEEKRLGQLRRKRVTLQRQVAVLRAEAKANPTPARLKKLNDAEASLRGVTNAAVTLARRNRELRSALKEPVALRDGRPTTPPREVEGSHFPVKRQPGMVYRGVSEGELRAIQEHGHISSEGSGNIGREGSGLTLFAEDPKTARAYASSAGARKGEKGYVLAVRAPKDAIGPGVRGATLRGEVAVRGPLDASHIDHVVEVTPETGRPHNTPASYRVGALDDFRTDRQHEYEQEVQKVIQKEGLAQPAFVSASDIRKEPNLGVEPSFQRAGKKIHPTTGYLMKTGQADLSLPALIRGSVEGPRVRRAMHATTVAFVNGEARKFNGSHLVTSKEAHDLVGEGKIDPKRETLFPLNQFQVAVRDVAHLGEVAQGEKFADALTRISDLVQNAEKLSDETYAAQLEPGRNYVVVPKEAAKEYLAQMSGVHEALRAAATVNSVFTRTILGTSPAWAIAQVAAEGTQALASEPRALLYANRYRTAIGKMSPEDRAAFAGVAGETPGVSVSPKDWQFSLRPDDMTTYQRGLDVIERTVPGRVLAHTARLEWLGMFDKYKGARFREAVLAAHVDRQLNGAMSGLQTMFREQSRLVKKLKGLPLEEQLTYIARHPHEAKEFIKGLDDAMGNWSALTRHERVAAPLVMFYPFLRMSLRWTLHTFPKAHPIKARIAYLLGQWNSNEVAKMLGGNPAFYQYAQAPIRGGKNGEATSLMPLQRIAPGSNTLIEAFGAKGSTFGASTIRGLSPVEMEAIVFLTGVDPLTGKRLEGAGGGEPGLKARGILALGQLMAMPYPVRLLDQMRGQRDFGSLPLFGKTKDQSDPVNQLFAKLDESSATKAIRSGVAPILPANAHKAQEKARLSEILNTMRINKVEDKDIYAAAQSGDAKQAKTLEARKKEYAKAGKELAKMLKDYGIDTSQSKGEFKAFFKKHPLLSKYPPAKKKKSGAFDFGSGTQAGSKFNFSQGKSKSAFNFGP